MGPGWAKLLIVWAKPTLQHTALDIMSWDGKYWTSCWFHTDYFNREYLFWTWLTSFKSRHFNLSIHISLISLRQVFTEIHVVLFTCLWREVTENAPCLFSLVWSDLAVNTMVKQDDVITNPVSFSLSKKKKKIHKIISAKVSSIPDLSPG